MSNSIELSAPQADARRKANAIRSRTILVDLLLFITVATALSWHLVGLAMQRFDFFDMSGFLDAGYRVSIGQDPYVDFFYNAGPVHLYMHALSFKLLGFNKVAVLTHLVVVHLAVLVAAYAIARRGRLSRGAGVLVLAMVSFSFFGTTAHPWYDQNASAFLVMALLVFELAYPFRDRAISWSAPAACGILAAFSLMAKSNIGLAGGATLFAALVVTAIRRRNLTCLAGYGVGCVLGFLLLFVTLASPAAFIRHNFFEYDTGSRFRWTSRLVEVIQSPAYTIFAVAIIVLIVAGGLKVLRDQAHRWVIAVGLILTSIFCAWTGSMQILANVVLHGFIVLELWIIASNIEWRGADRRNPAMSWRGYVSRTLGWVLAGWCATNAWHYRLHTWDWRPSNAQATYELHTPAFEGWYCNSAVGAYFDSAVTYVMENVPKDESLFVFPDCTMIYGITGRESYRGAAFIWDVIYPPKNVYAEFAARFQQSPPKWMLVHDQKEVPFFMARTLLEYMELMDFVVQNYRVVWQQGEFKMLKLRDKPTSAPTQAK